MRSFCFEYIRVAYKMPLFTSIILRCFNICYLDTSPERPVPRAEQGGQGHAGLADRVRCHQVQHIALIVFDAHCF